MIRPTLEERPTAARLKGVGLLLILANNRPRPALHLSRRPTITELRSARAQQHYFCEVAASTGADLALLLCFSNHASK